MVDVNEQIMRGEIGADPTVTRDLRESKENRQKISNLTKRELSGATHSKAPGGRRGRRAGDGRSRQVLARPRRSEPRPEDLAGLCLCSWEGRDGGPRGGDGPVVERLTAAR
jgi:hypothetical protein